MKSKAYAVIGYSWDDDTYDAGYEWVAGGV